MKIKSLILAIGIGLSILPCSFTYANSFLQNKYGISAEEAQLRLDLQEKVIALSEKLNAKNDPNYADMYIQHTPVYKIVILFSDNKNRHQFLKSLDPKLQRYVQIKNVKKSRRQYEKELNEFNQSLKSLNIPYDLMFDLEQQKFVITVEQQRHTRASKPTQQQEHIKAFKQIAQKLNKQGETVIEIGSVAKEQSAPSNVRPGDRIYGGIELWETSSDLGGYCTTGYAVNYKIGNINKQGILTSAHCDPTMYIDMNGRRVGLHSPDIRHYGGKYDYQIWETTGITLDNQIHFENYYNIPEFAKPNGKFRVTKSLASTNQKKGMIVCKSGANTGISCGEIVNANATFKGHAGWIRVEKTKQPNLSEGGDSGGPWFLHPGKSADITAVGIHKGGINNADYSPDEYAVYMPIDYIDDHNSSVNLILK